MVTLLPKAKSTKKKEYVEGPKARQNFDETMRALFRAPKTPKKGKD
jgi:hypothetical protein